MTRGPQTHGFRALAQRETVTHPLHDLGSNPRGHRDRIHAGRPSQRHVGTPPGGAEPVRPVVAVASEARCGMMRRLWHPLVDLAGAEIVEYWTPIGERYVTLRVVDRGQGFNHVDIPVDELVIR